MDRSMMGGSADKGARHARGPLSSRSDGLGPAAAGSEVCFEAEPRVSVVEASLP